jgi:hypothetical protein
MINYSARLCGCIAFAIGMAAPAQAYDWNITTQPTVVEATYMPASVNFQVANAASGSCPAGTFLVWNAKGADAAAKAANAAAVMSMVMTAKATNRSLVLFGNNSGCTIDFIWMN